MMPLLPLAALTARIKGSPVLEVVTEMSRDEIDSDRIQKAAYQVLGFEKPNHRGEVQKHFDYVRGKSTLYKLCFGVILLDTFSSQ